MSDLKFQVKRLVYGRDAIESHLSLTDDDVLSMRGLSSKELGALSPLSEGFSSEERGDDFYDARKWLGRSLGWFQFCAVSLRAALEGAETDTVLRERLGGDERRLERILHAAAFAIRHASGPFHYLADGRGLEVCKQADSLLRELSGESLHRLEVEEGVLVSRIEMAGFASEGARERLRSLVGDMVETNIADGNGSWNGSWHQDAEVVKTWHALCSALSIADESQQRLEVVKRLLNGIFKGVREAILQVMKTSGRELSAHEIAGALGIDARTVTRFAETLVFDDFLVLVEESSGFYTYRLVARDDA